MLTADLILGFAGHVLHLGGGGFHLAYAGTNLMDHTTHGTDHGIEALDDVTDQVTAFDDTFMPQIPIGDLVGHIGDSAQSSQHHNLDQVVIEQPNAGTGRQAPDDKPDFHPRFPVDKELGIERKDDPHKQAKGQKGIEQLPKYTGFHDHHPAVRSRKLIIVYTAIVTENT